MKRMSIDDIHGVLWDIAKLFHKICTENNIPYYMLGGTMLGAVRHNGFIPWDDDMDLGVPRKSYDKLIKVLQSQLPDRYMLLSSDEIGRSFGYYKICDKKTIIKEELVEKEALEFGVNIDIFVLDDCGLPNKSIKKIFKKRRLLGLIRQARIINHNERPLYYKIFYKLLLLLFPYNIDVLKEKHKKLLSDLSSSGSSAMVNYNGRYGIKEIVPKEIFGKPQLYDFESGQLYGPEQAHNFLKHMYGNYMQLPPEDQRKYHSTSTFWKDKSVSELNK